jgi:hypothetical protein
MSLALLFDPEDPCRQLPQISDASIKFYRTTRRYIPEKHYLDSYRCGDLKSYTGLPVP